MRRRALAICVLGAACALPLRGARIAGRVHGPDGRPLPQIAIRLDAAHPVPGETFRWQTATRDDGSFAIVIPEGAYVITISAADYGVFRRDVNVPPDAEIDAQLDPGLGASYQTVTVAASPLGPAAVQRVIDRGDIQNLKNTLADDPLRSVQTLPGVVATDDFRDDFSYRGTPFSDITIVIDGVRPAGVVHTVESSDTGSISFINSDALDSAELRSVDITQPSSGATLSLSTRPADSERFHASLAAGTASTSLSGGGPLPLGSAVRRPTLFAGARQSYLASLIRRVHPDTDVLFDFRDVFGRLDVPLGKRQALVVESMNGSALGRRGSEVDLSPFDLNREEGVLALQSLRWLAQAGSTTVALTAARSRNAFLNDTVGHYQQPSDRFSAEQFRAEAQWSDARSDLTGGIDTERLSIEQDFGAQPEPDGSVFFSLPLRNRLNDLLGFVEDGIRVGNVRLTSGVNFQHSGYFQATPLSGDATVAWNLGLSSVHAALARVVQFPLTTNAALTAGPRNLFIFPFSISSAPITPFPPQDAELIEAGVMRRVGQAAIEISAYRRNVLDAYLSPAYVPWKTPVDLGPFPAGTAVMVLDPARAGRLHAYGLEINLQGRFRSNLHGWLSYVHSRARIFENSFPVAHYIGLKNSPGFPARYPADFDVPNAFSTYLSYRPRPAWNLVAVARASNNVPIRGFYSGHAPDLVITSGPPNQARLPAYLRVDLRLERDFFIRARRLAMFGEMLNVTGRNNQRYFTTELRFDPASGVVTQQPEDLLPRLLGAGVRIDF